MADFFDHSKVVVREFLQTAVVVDDEARYPPEEVIVGTLVPPEPEALATVAPMTSGAPSSPEGAAVAAAEGFVDHPLNAEEVVEAFAGIGVVAAVMRPDKGTRKQEDDFEKSFLLAAGRADIVVLDWSVKRDEGRRAKRLIKQLLKADARVRRLRLITVYTGELDLVSITRSIQEDLAGMLESTEDEFVLAKGGLRVSVLAKKESNSFKGAAKQRVTPLPGLPERIVEEFAGMTAGLLSNVALGSIASLRKNTHRLTAKFRPSLDAAFLADAMARGDYAATVDLATALVGREMRNVFDQNEVDALLGLDVVESWLQRRRAAGAAFVARREGEPPLPLSDDVLVDLIERGNKASKLPTGVKPGTLSFPDILDGPDLDDAAAHEYAMLSFLDRSHTDAVGYAGTRKPVLSLGTVVERTTGQRKGDLLVCTQAVCDSVRVYEPRVFPFLPLSVAGGKDFDLAVRRLSGARVRLNVALKQFKVQQYTFDPDPKSGTVRPTANGLFRAHARQSFGWVAQLRPEQAQRLINSFGNLASRVGLDETESGSSGRRSKLDG